MKVKLQLILKVNLNKKKSKNNIDIDDVPEGQLNKIYQKKKRYKIQE